MAEPVDQVGRWLAEHDQPNSVGLRLAREIILGADERVTETVKWGTPTFMYKGNILSFTPTKNGVGLMFHRGAEIPGQHPRMEGDGKLVRTMRFSDSDEVEEGRGEIEAVISAWCEWRDSETG